jgi:hypothetical protein
MHISQWAIGNDSHPKIDTEFICPYLTAISNFCSASIMVSTVNSERKISHCSTEDYDRCPLFLAKVSRGG